MRCRHDSFCEIHDCTTDYRLVARSLKYVHTVTRREPERMKDEGGTRE